MFLSNIRMMQISNSIFKNGTAPVYGGAISYECIYLSDD